MDSEQRLLLGIALQITGCHYVHCEQLLGGKSEFWFQSWGGGTDCSKFSSRKRLLKRCGVSFKRSYLVGWNHLSTWGGGQRGAGFPSPWGLGCAVFGNTYALAVGRGVWESRSSSCLLLESRVTSTLLTSREGGKRWGPVVNWGPTFSICKSLFSSCLEPRLVLDLVLTGLGCGQGGSCIFW